MLLQVRELVLPLAAHALARAWRPVSARQSRQAAALLADLLVYVPAEEPAMAVRAPRAPDLLCDEASA